MNNHIINAQTIRELTLGDLVRISGEMGGVPISTLLRDAGF